MRVFIAFVAGAALVGIIMSYPAESKRLARGAVDSAATAAHSALSTGQSAADHKLTEKK